MIKIGNSKPATINQSTKALVYGFDRKAFEFPSTVQNIEKWNVHFARYQEPVELTNYEYIIIPSGIFEILEEKQNWFDSHTSCSFDDPTLTSFERMLFNAIKKEKTVIFLMGRIVNTIKRDDYSYINIHHTDLAKKTLLNFFPQSEGVQRNPHLTHSRNEFQRYTEKYGVGKTAIARRNEGFDFSTLIQSANKKDIFGVELLDKKLFFLPYHTTQNDLGSLIDLSKSALDSVRSYIQNHTINIPNWVKQFQLGREEELNSEIIELEKKIENKSEELSRLDSYKSILSSQGEPLAEQVISILKNFFHLNINDIDEKLDDFSILDENNKVIATGEIKGASKDCKRQYLSQLNSNRDLKEYPPETKGLLIINDNMKLQEIDKKFDTKIPDDCIKYAEKENINILRTIDFLNLMKLHFNKPHDQRKEEFRQIIKGSPGWIKCDGRSSFLMNSK